MGRRVSPPSEAQDAAVGQGEPDARVRRSRVAPPGVKPRDRFAMSASARLGLVMLAPSFVIVVLLFLAPVILTGVFSFTTMTTGTGIRAGAYQIDDVAGGTLRSQGVPAEILDRLGAELFAIDDATLAAARQAGVSEVLVSELATRHHGESFPTRLAFERFLKSLSARPATTRDLKAASASFRRSIVNTRYESREAFLAALDGLDLKLDSATTAKIEDTAYTGWRWTTANYTRMLSSAESFYRLLRTVLYVGATVALFNVGFALMLAITTFFLPSRTAAAIRALWLLPRILPPVLYVLLWKWLAWDNGFLSTVLAPFGVASRNWLLDNSVNAWIFVILINGFVGASMGMIIFSSAIRAIPVTLFYASATDGASTLQQVRHVILPQLRWPILFVTCYQTLSLLASFEYILLSTNGRPGTSTEVWALAAYHTALSNYTGNLEYGLGAALAIVLVVIGLIASTAYLRLFNFATLVPPPRIEQ
jgi:inositol-phosphate transport system permease protein